MSSVDRDEELRREIISMWLGLAQGQHTLELDQRFERLVSELIGVLKEKGLTEARAAYRSGRTGESRWP